MKKLIVTADDYGVVPSINEGIIEAVNEGLVNSVGVFANYKGDGHNGKRYPGSLENLAALIERTGNKADIGCHLTITSGKPLTSRNDLAFLLNGFYFPDFGAVPYENSVPARRALRDELIAQVEELEKVPGCKVKYLTNHHDSLTFYQGYYDVYLEVAAQLKLPIRSADIRPASKPHNYRMIVRLLMLRSGTPLKTRKEISRFGDSIIQYFADVNDGVRCPTYMDGRHYGPPAPIDPVTKWDFEQEKKKKLKRLKKAIRDFIKDQEATSMELMLHLCQDKINAINTYSDIDYPGIASNYFGGRITELESIKKFGKVTHPEIQYASWDDVQA